jgi:glycerol-3-phosphate dehydrogenase
VKRDLAQLARNEHDVLVIGAGIYGACVAWDAALRGLSVALVDKGDFGNATSANSLKTIHGGLRYLQDVNPRLMRTMARERTTWMRIAPHTVHPLPCLTPTYEKFSRSRTTFAAALLINDLISYGRNQIADTQKHIPGGRTISRTECLELLPGLAADGVTGGAIWYDAQIYNSERLLLSLILSAAQAGAGMANYVEVIGFLGNDMSVTGVKARDVLSGQEFEIQAKLVINSSGAWVDSVVGSLNGHSLTPKFHPSIALNLVTRQILPEYGVGVTSRYIGRDRHGKPTPRSRMLFIVPWRQYSIVGTIHTPYAGQPDEFRVREEVVEDFVDEVNTAYPGAMLTSQDVYHLHRGFLPMIQDNGQTDLVKLVRQTQVCDHERDDGIQGLITVVGVKYTTARKIAQDVVDLAVEKLGRKAFPCRTHEVPIQGGQISQFNDFLVQAIEQRPFGLGPDVIRHLVYNYGSEYHKILKYLDQEPAWGHTIADGTLILQAEVVHAIREEMAQKLADVVQRRTELGAVGLPEDAKLRVCADLMAAELGWDQARREQELDDVRAAYAVPPALIKDQTGAS